MDIKFSLHILFYSHMVRQNMYIITQKKQYKDRISVGRTIKIQGNSNDELIFFIEKDENYNDPEKESSAPVVNCVGFWNLLKAPKQGEIRTIIHLNQEQAVNVNFGFLINQHNSSVTFRFYYVFTHNSHDLNICSTKVLIKLKWN